MDRGLPPFTGLTAGLNANAQRGADIANDPPDPGTDYDVVDTEWAGGSSNGLDAVYGWIYDDGIGSGNLDCPKGGGAGCWGHRHGILDNFGTVRFRQASVVRDTQVLNISQSGAHPITMITPAGLHLAEPSALGDDGESFSVTRTSIPSPSPGGSAPGRRRGP